MQIRKNISPKERIVRVAGGIVMMLCGLIGLQATPLGWAIATAGLVSVATGLIRYCPACAIAGRNSADNC